MYQTSEKIIEEYNYLMKVKISFENSGTNVEIKDYN